MIMGTIVFSVKIVLVKCGPRLYVADGNACFEVLYDCLVALMRAAIVSIHEL